MTRMSIASLIHHDAMAITSAFDPPTSSTSIAALHKRPQMFQRKDSLISKTLNSPRNIVPMHAFYLPRPPYESSPNLSKIPTSPISPTSSSSTTESIPMTQAPVALDFSVSEDNVHAASRLIGQKHREKETEALVDLQAQVDRLREKNRFLLLSKQQVESSLNPSESYELRSMSQKTIGEDNGHRVSDRTAETLGAYHCSGTAAIVLLEIVAMRRNLVSVGPRSRFLECPPEKAFEAMLNSVKKTFLSSQSSSQPLFMHVIYDWVLNAHKNWSRTEDSTEPTMTSYPSHQQLTIGATRAIERSTMQESRRKRE